MDGVQHYCIQPYERLSGLFSRLIAFRCHHVLRMFCVAGEGYALILAGYMYNFALLKVVRYL